MTEKILVKKAKKGSERAFHRLFELHAGRLYRFLKQFSQDTDIVEDWVQQAFIKAFRNINSFESRSKFGTWLFQIGINEMREDFRRQKNFEETSCVDENLIMNETVEELFEWKDEMKWLLSDIDREKKAVFILFEVEGYNHAEIADMLGISEQNSRTTLSRLKTYLRNKWNREYNK